MPQKESTAKESGRTWSVFYVIASHSKGNPQDSVGAVRSGEAVFRARTNDEAKGKMLAILQRKIARIKNVRARVFIPEAFPQEPEEGASVVYAHEMIRLKPYYANRRLLRIRNPDVALVQGYGPKAHDKLFGLITKSKNSPSNHAP